MLAPLQYDTLDHFIAWLETCDPTRTFNVWNAKTCALGQYDTANGRPISCNLSERFDGRGLEIVLGVEHYGEDNIYREAIPFGDVLRRAREIRGY